MHNEGECVLRSLRSSINELQEEIKRDPDFEEEGIRLMREGIGVFIDEFIPDMYQFWLSPTLRFNPEKVSFERVGKNSVIQAEETPGGVELWKNKAEIIVGMLEANLR